jgi:protein phosphatase 4 regulatory subunit 3
MQRAKDDPGVEKFLEYFYKSCIDTLFKPFSDIPEFRQLQSEIPFLMLTLATNFFWKSPPSPCQRNEQICSFISAICCAIFPFNILSAAISSYSPPTSPSESLPFFHPEINIYVWVCFTYSPASARLTKCSPAAFRFFRICLRINNRNLFSHLIKLDVLQPIIDLAVKESVRDNLISSSCQEFFDHLRKVRPYCNRCLRCYSNLIIRRTSRS